MYKLIFAKSCPHREPLWDGRTTTYTFDTVDELKSFMQTHLPVSHRTIDNLRHSDRMKKSGEIYKTLWYTVEKLHSPIQ